MQSGSPGESNMYVIAVASQKGGSGKTTLAGHLAVQADRTGFGPVALVDTDPQGSLSEWWNARAAETPLFARASAGRFAADIERMRELGIKLLVVDTPPAIEATITEVISLADLVVIPARPSPHDLRAAGATVELIERVGKPLVFVINAATPRARITSEAVMALSQHGSLPLDPARHRRLRLAAAHLDQTEEALMLAALDHYLDRVVSPLLDGRCACLEEGRTSGQGCVAATFSSAKSERAQ